MLSLGLGIRLGLGLGLGPRLGLGLGLGLEFLLYLRGVDDGREGADAEHAEVGHREGPPLIFLGQQLAQASPARQVLNTGVDVA